MGFAPIGRAAMPNFLDSFVVNGREAGPHLEHACTPMHMHDATIYAPCVAQV